ncbi:MAG: hypothetical protein U5Q44_06420 [Dehalococcoidia bacterium]|nr:hypothetical protein [Dehalococcoidia bacterium]
MTGSRPSCHRAPLRPSERRGNGQFARLFAPLRQCRESMIGERDLQIAATALANGHDVLTYNVGEFRRVPGLRVLTIDADGRLVEA